MSIFCKHFYEQNDKVTFCTEDIKKKNSIRKVFIMLLILELLENKQYIPIAIHQFQLLLRLANLKQCDLLF